MKLNNSKTDSGIFTKQQKTFKLAKPFQINERKIKGTSKIKYLKIINIGRTAFRTLYL